MGDVVQGERQVCMGCSPVVQATFGRAAWQGCRRVSACTSSLSFWFCTCSVLQVDGEEEEEKEEQEEAQRQSRSQAKRSRQR